MEIAQSRNLTAAFGMDLKETDPRICLRHCPRVPAFTVSHTGVSEQQYGMEMQILKREYDESNAFEFTVMPVPRGLNLDVHCSEHAQSAGSTRVEFHTQR